MPSISLRSRHRNADTGKGCVRRDGDYGGIAGVQQWLAVGRAVHFELGMAFALVALHQNEIHRGLALRSSAGSVGSAPPRSSGTTVHLVPAGSNQHLGRARRCSEWAAAESFPGRSVSKLWCACLTVDTFQSARDDEAE